ncbi:hypothetical protein [Arthrobacter sp. OY3WO11]|uniref:hypothetical protein n=1 Tax=Arthrobacter sp. OY3WO11 TaxID=1835723 RepID=UPI000AF1DE85|nr:hypothetical protein [Arthrobacter sp. OY3WO11]
MNHIRPVQLVIDLLSKSGYVTLPDFKVGSLAFDFTKVLAGTQYSFDLVVIVDTISEFAESRLRRQVAALARALDLVESRRSVTLILVGPGPSDITIRELARVCRVLSVGVPTGEHAEAMVRDVLAVLLPLSLPRSSVAGVNPLSRLRHELERLPELAVLPMLDVADAGDAKVELALKEWLSHGIIGEQA